MKCGERGATDLDLKQVIAADALVVHLMISVISITAALILDEGKAAGRSAHCSSRGNQILTGGRSEERRVGKECPV